MFFYETAGFMKATKLQQIDSADIVSWSAIINLLSLFYSIDLLAGTRALYWVVSSGTGARIRKLTVF